MQRREEEDEMMTLEQIANEATQETVKAKPPRHMHDTEIANEYTPIMIPHGATLIRTGGRSKMSGNGLLKFFYGEAPESTTNGWIKIPSNAEAVYMKGYQTHMHHINYGTPEWVTRKV